MMSDDKKKFSKLVLSERDKGNVVFLALDEIMSAPVKEIIKQPADGLLWDLNRDEATALSFMDKEGMNHWVNNFAVALVIRELKLRLELKEIENAALKRENSDIIQNDMKHLMNVLGMSTHARPQSPHEVFTSEIIPAVAALKEYATHKPGCYENSELCICGLDALLTAEESE